MAKIFSNPILAALAYLLVAIEANGQSPIGLDRQAEILAVCSQKMGIKFPRDTSVLGYEYQQGMDDYLHLKIKIRKESLKELLENFPMVRFSNKLSSAYLNERLSWWQPEKIADPMSGEGWLAPGRVIRIVFPAYPTEDTEVYLNWFET